MSRHTARKGVRRRNNRRHGTQARALQFERLEQRQLLAGDLLGSWDTNGDGVLESVFDNGTSIRIERANGRSDNYYLGADWTLATIADTDGIPGQEIVVDTPDVVKIIRDASEETETYYLGNTWTH